jgi:hypothetical protein
MVDAFHAVRCLEKKRTNSGPFMESTSKHSIYPQQPVRRSEQLPIGAEFGEQAGGEEGVAVPIALAWVTWINIRSFSIGDLETDNLTDAQAPSICGYQ